MSWGSRFGLSGRWSPFGRGSQAAQVTDQDYSYITAEDLAQTGTPNRPPREADILVFRHNKTSYPVHFPGYSIDNGTLTVGAARQKAASEIGVPDARRIRMFYKGRVLKDDVRAFKDEGFRSGSDPEILVVVGESLPQQQATPNEVDEDESEDEFAEAVDGQGGEATAGKKKKKSKRGKKKGKRANDPTASQTQAPPLPQQPQAPATPLAKLDALASVFHTTLVPQCIKYQANPPDDPAKREFEHKRLTETILQQVLLKVDGVEVEGDQEARARRKELVREVQGMMNTLDSIVKV